MWLFLTYSIGDELIGAARITRRSENECELHSLYVDPKFRGRYYGTKLLQKIIKVVEDEGFEIIYLTTFPYMKSAKSLYEKMGFVISEFVEIGNIDRAYAKETVTIFMKLDMKAMEKKN